MAEDSGAYRLTLHLEREVELRVGRLGRFRFAPGRYVYVGSAKRALSKRVARHRRLAEEKQGKLHWHVDYLLTSPACRVLRAEAIPGGEECRLAAELAARRGVRVPVPGFGASDCRAGCAAHLYRVK